MLCIIVIIVHSYCYVFLLCYVLLYVYVILLLCIFRSAYSLLLYFSVYCLYVNVYCITATGCQPGGS